MASFFGVALGEGKDDGDGEERAFETHFAGVGEGTSPVTIFFTADKNGFDAPAVGAAVELPGGFGCWDQIECPVASKIAPMKRSRFIVALRG